MEDLINRVDTLSRAIIQPETPFLAEAEAQAATAVLSKPVFSRVIRSKNDPRLSGQDIGLFSFTPSRNAQPDSFGVYGVAKLRGNYATPRQAAEAAEILIREVDSINEIVHVRVGESFPLTVESKWTEGFDAIDLNKRVDDIQREKQQSAEHRDEQERKTLMAREKKMLEENKEILTETYKEDPLEQYIRLNVARAQLKWSKADVERKVEEELKPGIARRTQEIKEMDLAHPEYRTQFLKQYMDARHEACLSNDVPVDHEKVQQGFLKYLCEDL